MSIPSPTEGIVTACQLLSGRCLAASEVEALVDATGSREELVAHLIIDWRVLEFLQQAREALQTQIFAVKFSGSRAIVETTPPAWPDELSHVESLRHIERFVCPPGDEDVALVLLELGPAVQTGGPLKVD